MLALSLKAIELSLSNHLLLLVLLHLLVKLLLNLLLMLLLLLLRSW